MERLIVARVARFGLCAVAVLLCAGLAQAQERKGVLQTAPAAPTGNVKPKAEVGKAAGPPVATPQSVPSAATPQWPKTLPEVTPADGAAPAWSKSEIEAAQAQCARLLDGLPVVAMQAEPIREGECGAPAPVQLVSIGRSPQVTFSPPVTVTCDMVSTLATWLEKDVQPLARQLLGSAVIRIETMSSYSCRNAYGRKKTRLSEHGRANAIDIRSFLTDRNQDTDLLANWGPTARDVRAAVAAAEAERRKAEQAAAKAGRSDPSVKVATPPSATAPAAKVATPAEASGPIRGTIAETELSATSGATQLLGGRAFQPPFSLVPPSRLGGPKVQASDPNSPVNVTASARQRFLRLIHAAACKRFGTVLGPEANEAHRNHFHLDMAERRSGSYCE